MVGAPATRPRISNFGAYPWELRTLIAVGAPGSPLGFLNLNWVLGRTGTRFDQSPQRSRSAARRAADLQFCLQTPDGAVTYKREHSVVREVQLAPGSLGVAGRLAVDDQDELTRIRFEEPEAQLELTADFRPWAAPLTWVAVRGLYTHRTEFGTASLRWSRAGERHEVDVAALLDLGWGRSLLPLRAPLRSFHYQVLRLGPSASILALGVAGPLGLPVIRRGALREAEGRPARVGHLRTEVVEWRSEPDHTGTLRSLPRRWRTRLDLGGEPLAWEGTSDDRVHPILGDGFVHGLSWRSLGAPVCDAACGSGYAEHFGRP